MISTFALVFVARFALVQCGAPGLASMPVALPPPPERTPNASAPPATAARLRGSEGVVAGSEHLALGVPRDADPSDDFYLDERAYALSYAPDKRVANWVAWRLDRSQLGRLKRKNDFRPDPALPSRFYRVKDSDYARSGYDRGHLCPSADRTATPADNSRTFLFTNMQPQLHELNSGPWEHLETYARQRARRGEVLYVVAGGVFSAPFPTIGNGVAVPAASFKIVAFLREGQRSSEVTADTEVLAALMPNQPGVAERDWTEYLTSVDAIEQATGYDFLTAIPGPIQRVIEARTAHP